MHFGLKVLSIKKVVCILATFGCILTRKLFSFIPTLLDSKVTSDKSNGLWNVAEKASLYCCNQFIRPEKLMVSLYFDQGILFDKRSKYLFLSVSSLKQIIVWGIQNFGPPCESLMRPVLSSKRTFSCNFRVVRVYKLLLINLFVIWGEKSLALNSVQFLSPQF